MVLVAVVTLILVCVWFSLALGAGNIFKMVVRYDDGPGELVLIPPAVLAGAVVGSRLAVFRPRPWSSWWPALPLMLAGALIGLFAFLGWVWEGPVTVLSPARIPGALLTVAVVFAAAALHPRLMAVLAGAIAAPTLFALVAYMVPDELISTIGAEIWTGGTGRILGASNDAWYHTELSQTFPGRALYHLMRWIGYWGPAALLGASSLSFRLRRPALGHACWAGAVALFVGTGQFYLQMVGEGFGR